MAGRYTIQLQTAKKGICWPWLNPSIKTGLFVVILKKIANNGSMQQNFPGFGSWSLLKKYIFCYCVDDMKNISKDSLLKLRLLFVHIFVRQSTRKQQKL